MPDLPRPPRIPALATIAAALVAALAPLAVAPTAAGQETAAATVVLVDGPDEPAELAARTFWVEDPATTPVFHVRFARPVPAPGLGDTYRISIQLGDPTGERLRGSIVWEGGVPVGRLERGDGTTWEPAEPTFVSLRQAEATIEFPVGEVSDDKVAWLEIEHRRDGADVAIFRSALQPLGAVRGAGLSVGPAPMAWVDIEGLPVASALRNPPAIQAVGGLAIVTYDALVPVDVERRGVDRVVDVVSIVAEVRDPASDRFLLAIDHRAGTTVLFRGTEALPVEVVAEPGWVLRGLPETGVGAGDELVFDLEAVFDALGVEAAGASTAIGMFRTITLEGGDVVEVQGPVATLDWFTTAQPLPDPAPTATTVADGEPSSADDGGLPLPLLLVGVGALLVAVALGVFLLRPPGRPDRASFLERPQDDDEDGAGDEAASAAADLGWTEPPEADPLPAVEDLTRELFDG